MKYTVTDLGEHFNNQYPYKYRVSLLDSDVILNRIVSDDYYMYYDWLADTNIPATIINTVLYMRSESDVAMFLLRFA